IFHDDEHPALVGPVDLAHADDAGRLAGRSEAGVPPALLHELLAALELFRENLDCDLVPGGELLGQVQRAQAAPTQLPDYPIPLRDRLSDETIHLEVGSDRCVHLAGLGIVAIDPAACCTALHRRYSLALRVS